MASGLFAGELSGNVLTQEQVEKVGTAPSASDLHGVVFPFACDFKLSFEPGDFVIVPRSKGGFCYGVLDTSKRDGGGTTVWTVSVGPKTVKPAPEGWLGKIVAAGASRGGFDTLGEPQRAIGRAPLPEDIGDVVFSVSNKFEPLEVVLMCRARGGFIYGYVVEASGKGHYLAKSHYRDTRDPERLPRYGLGKLKIDKAQQQAILGPVMSQGIDVEAVTTLGQAKGGGRGREDKNKVHVLQHRGKQQQQQQQQRRHQRGDDFSSSPAHERSSPAQSPSSPPQPSSSSSSILRQGSKGSMGSVEAREDEAEADSNTCSHGGRHIFGSEERASTRTSGGISARVPRTKYPEFDSDGKRIVNLPPPSTKLFVIDAANVAVTHGKNAAFSSRGVAIALSHFESQGHTALAFLPSHYLNDKAALYSMREKQIPDDTGILQVLVDQGKLVMTPSQDYDDGYIIDYARRHDGTVVSNDRFRDYTASIARDSSHLGKQVVSLHEMSIDTWLSSRVLSYAFVGDEFVPNPAFRADLKRSDQDDDHDT